MSGENMQRDVLTIMTDLLVHFQLPIPFIHKKKKKRIKVNDTCISETHYRHCRVPITMIQKNFVLVFLFLLLTLAANDNRP